jgi:hypothetical protein
MVGQIWKPIDTQASLPQRGQGSTGAQQPDPNQDVGQINTSGQPAPQAPQNNNPNAGAPQSGGQAK